MRKLQDPENTVLKQVLDNLVTENVEVTIREVARRHPRLKNVSAFTRNRDRMALIDEAMRRQAKVRAIAARSQLHVATTTDGTELQQARIETLERQVRHLVAAHAGLIRAVQLAGGMSALERFWKEYRVICDEIVALNAVPPDAVVQVIPERPSGSLPTTTISNASDDNPARTEANATTVTV